MLIQGPILPPLMPPPTFMGRTVRKHYLKDYTIFCLAATAHIAR